MYIYIYIYIYGRVSFLWGLKLFSFRPPMKLMPETGMQLGIKLGMKLGMKLGSCSRSPRSVNTAYYGKRALRFDGKLLWKSLYDAARMDQRLCMLA